MNIELEKRNSTFIVKIKGEIDHHTCEIIKNSVDGGLILHKCKNIIFDFCGVNFMDSSGIGMIIGRYKRTAVVGGVVVATSLNDEMKKLFELTGIKKIIKVFDGIDEAIKYIEEGEK